MGTLFPHNSRLHIRIHAINNKSIRIQTDTLWQTTKINDLATRCMHKEEEDKERRHTHT